MRTLVIPYLAAVSMSGALTVAYWLNLAESPLRPVNPISGACGPSVRGVRIARNVSDVDAEFEGHPWRGI